MQQYFLNVPGCIYAGVVNLYIPQSIRIYADSCFKTFPPLYSSLNITKIIQSLNLTDAITDDSNAKVHQASSIDKLHADSFG